MPAAMATTNLPPPTTVLTPRNCHSLPADKLPCRRQQQWQAQAQGQGQGHLHAFPSLYRRATLPPPPPPPLPHPRRPCRAAHDSATDRGSASPCAKALVAVAARPHTRRVRPPSYLSSHLSVATHHHLNHRHHRHWRRPFACHSSARDRSSNGSGREDGEVGRGAEAESEAVREPECEREREMDREREADEAEREREVELLRALNLEPDIPEDSTAFLNKISSRAYDMRRRLEQSMQADLCFDVVEANPWQPEERKSVYVLAKEDEQLYTMRTRQPRTEVESELDLLFWRRHSEAQAAAAAGPRAGDRPGAVGGGHARAAGGASGSVSAASAAQLMGGGGSQSSQRLAGTRSNSSSGGGGSGIGGLDSRQVRMHVEDVREGILVFEDEDAAAQYCSVLADGADPGCLGVAEFDAKELFKVCQSSKALAVIFRKGTVPPAPDYLRRTLRARKHSLED